MKTRIASGLITVLFICHLTSAEQILPEYFHSIPILIEIPLHDGKSVSFGTGAFASYSKKTFLITAAHCLFNLEGTNKNELINADILKLSSEVAGDPTKTNAWILNLELLNKLGQIKRHPTHDIAVVYIGDEIASSNGASILSVSLGTTKVLSYTPPLAGYDLEQTACLFTNVLDGYETYIFGYPVALLNEPFPHEMDFRRPIIRKGIVSQRNFTTQKLIIDSAVYGGNSGGPVLAVTHPSFGVTQFKIIGLITEYVPVSAKIFPQDGITNNVVVNSGYSVAEPIDFALELMRQF